MNSFRNNLIEMLLIVKKRALFKNTWLNELSKKITHKEQRDAFVSQIERFIRIMTLRNKYKTNRQWYVG